MRGSFSSDNLEFALYILRYIKTGKRFMGSPDSARRQLLVTAGILLLLGTSASVDGALIRLDFEQLVQRSGLVVCGEVVDLTASWEDVPRLGRLIVTTATIRVSESWKGSPGRHVTVQYYGGTVGDERQFCFESPRYEKGEKVLVFARAGHGGLWTTGWLQGKFRLVEVRGVSHVVGSSRMAIRGLEQLSRIRDSVKVIRARLEASKPNVVPSGTDATEPMKR